MSFRGFTIAAAAELVACSIGAETLASADDRRTVYPMLPPIVNDDPGDETAED